MRLSTTRLAVVAALLISSPTLRAGLCYSGEKHAELPSQWRGFLLDQRLKRGVAVRPKDGATPGLIRDAEVSQDE